MASIVTIGGVTIFPTPLVNISQECEYYESGKLKSTTMVAEIKGKILSQDKDEAPPNDNERLAIIQQKWNTIQNGANQALNSIFLSINPNVPIMTSPCKIRSKTFDIAAGNIYADFSIVLERTIVQNDYVNEKWSLDPSDEYNRFLKITRSRSIQYKDDETKNGYQKALEKIPVSTTINIGAIYFPESIISINDDNAYNKSVSYTTNKVNGTVDCTETWTLCKESAYIESTYVFRETSDSIHPNVIYQGTIYGLESSSKTKYQNALERANREITWSMKNGFSIPGFENYGSKIVSMSKGTNPAAGTITFSVEVTKGIEKPGERFRSVNITDNKPTPLYANIQAVGKQEGPILQKIGTFKAGQKSVSIDIVREDGSTDKPDTYEYAPIDATEFFVDKDETTIDQKSKKVSRQTSWTYTNYTTTTTTTTTTYNPCVDCLSQTITWDSYVGSSMEVRWPCECGDPLCDLSIYYEEWGTTFCFKVGHVCSFVWIPRSYCPSECYPPYPANPPKDQYETFCNYANLTTQSNCQCR